MHMHIYIYIYYICISLFNLTYNTPVSIYTEKSHKNIMKEDLISCKIYND